MKRKLKIFLLVVIGLSFIFSITIIPVSAAEERPIKECALFIQPDGYHFVDDWLDENFTTVEKFQIYQHFQLRLFLENGLNFTATIWFPDFDNEDVKHVQNMSLKAYDYQEMKFTVNTIGIFALETRNITNPFFEIHVLETVYEYFYQRPMILSVVSFPLFILCGIVGQTVEAISEGNKKQKLKNRLKKLKDKIPIFSNPSKLRNEEIIHAYNKFKQISNVPISEDDIQEAFEDTITGFKYMITNPALLVQSQDKDIPPETGKRIITLQVVKKEDLPNDFKKSLIDGKRASVSVALLLKHKDAANRNLLSMVGRLQSQIRLLKSEKANLKHERDVLDRGLVEADGSIIRDSLPLVEAQEESFFKKYKGIVISVGVFLGISLLVLLGIVIYNAMSTTGGI